MSHDVADALGYLGSALGVAMIVPQLIRTYRHRNMPGVSASAWALTGLACFTWLLYGIRTSEAPQIPGNVFMVTGAAVLVLVVPSRLAPRRRAATLLAAAVLLIALAGVLPPAVIGAIGFGVGLVSGLPQLVVSLRRRRGASANSLLTWVLRIVSQACWLAYAVAVGDAVVTVSASFLGASAALVVAAELLRRPAPTLPLDAAPAPVLVEAGQLPSATG